MRCAILRLASRGVPAETPREAADSKKIQATTSPVRPVTTLHPHASKTSGLGSGQVTPIVEVERVESWPQLRIKGPSKRRNLRRTQQARAQRRIWSRVARRRCRGTQDASRRRRGGDPPDGSRQRVCLCRRRGGWQAESPAVLCGNWPIQSRSGADRKRLVRRGTLTHSTAQERSSVPIAAPRSLKLADPFQQHPWKSAGPKD